MLNLTRSKGRKDALCSKKNDRRLAAALEPLEARTLLSAVPADVTPSVLEISPTTGIGAAPGAITDGTEQDRVDFTVPAAGDWTVKVAAKGTLDATLAVADALGASLTGDAPLNATAAAGVESWTGALQAGTTYSILLASADATSGQYTVSVERVWPAGQQPALPAVRVVADRKAIGENSSGSVRFTISRRQADVSAPLRVYYTMAGTATNGEDYSALSGSVLIPARKTSVTVLLLPVKDSSPEGRETAALKLRLLPGYQVAKPTYAKVSITEEAILAGWPNAPFDSHDIEGAIFTNQFGDAYLRKLKLDSGSDMDVFQVFTDDPGPLNIQLTGDDSTQVGFYDGVGRPDEVTGDAMTVQSPADKRMLYLAVQSTAKSATTSALYGMNIEGATPYQVEDMPISKLYAGSSGSDISSPGDYDYYRVKLPVSGNWLFRLIPDKQKDPLDGQLVVYNGKGIPVGGTWTKPVDKAGQGGIEQWLGVGLRAGETYVMRVDGKGDSLGGYGVACYITDAPPTVTASSPTAATTEGSNLRGRVVFTRSEVTAKPMTVRYTLGGTARNTADFERITGTAVIPAGKKSVTVYIRALADALDEGDEKVVVKLRESGAYAIGGKGYSAVTIKDAAVVPPPVEAASKARTTKARTPTKGIAFDGPIVISRGGTYSGNWQSLKAGTPAVYINTNEPVVIEDSVIRSRGVLIEILATRANVTVRNTSGYGLNPEARGAYVGRFIDADGFANVRVVNNYLENTSGIYLARYTGNRTAAQTVKILYNTVKNVDGRVSNGNGGWLNVAMDADNFRQFAQLNAVHGVAGAEIAWNQVINVQGQSRVEENINIHDSWGTRNSPIRIHDNYLQGAFPANSVDARTYTGGGIMVSDNGSSYVHVYNNQVVGTGQVGITITSGHDNLFYNNRIISDGRTPSGARMGYSNVGAVVWNFNGEGAFGRNSGKGNLIGWVGRTGARNDAWVPDASVWSKNKIVKGKITKASEAAEMRMWQSKLASKGRSLGPA